MTVVATFTATPSFAHESGTSSMTKEHIDPRRFGAAAAQFCEELSAFLGLDLAFRTGTFSGDSGVSARVIAEVSGETVTVGQVDFVEDSALRAA